MWVVCGVVWYRSELEVKIEARIRSSRFQYKPKDRKPKVLDFNKAMFRKEDQDRKYAVRESLIEGEMERGLTREEAEKLVDAFF